MAAGRKRRKVGGAGFVVKSRLANPAAARPQNRHSRYRQSPRYRTGGEMTGSSAQWAAALLTTVMVTAPPSAAAPLAPTALALKRVVLSSGGVGYFEYEA